MREITTRCCLNRGMFKSDFISNLLSTRPVQEHSDLINRIGYSSLCKVEELQSEFDAINGLIKNELNDFSKEMIIRKILLLLREKEFRHDDLCEYNDLIDYCRNSTLLPPPQSRISDEYQMSDLVKQEISRLSQNIDKKLNQLGRDYSKVELKQFSDLLEHLLKNTPPSLEATSSEVPLSGEDQELQSIFKEFESLDRPIELPFLVTNSCPEPPLLDSPKKRNLRSKKYSLGIPTQPSTPNPNSSFNRRVVLEPISSFKKSLLLN